MKLKSKHIDIKDTPELILWLYIENTCVTTKLKLNTYVKISDGRFQQILDTRLNHA